MSTTNERKKVNPNLQEAVSPARSSRFIEHMDRSPATPEELERFLALGPASFPEPPVTFHDDLRPSPTPYPLRAPAQPQEADKGDVGDSKNPLAPPNPGDMAGRRYVRPDDKPENPNVANWNADAVPQRRGAIRRPNVPPPRQRLPVYPITIRSPMNPSYRTPRETQAEGATKGSHTAQKSTCPGLQGNKPVPKLPPLNTNLTPPKRAQSSRTRPIQTLPSGSVRGPAKTFDEILKGDLKSRAAPQSPAPSSKLSSLSLKSLTASTRRGMANALKKSQQLITPRSSAMKRTETEPILSSTTKPNSSAAPLPLPLPLHLARAKRTLSQLHPTRTQWTRSPPCPAIPTRGAEIREVQHLLAQPPGPADESPTWNLARHSWKSMGLRTQYEKAGDGDGDGDGDREWNRLEARRRVRARSRVREDFGEAWEAWVREQSGEVRDEARGGWEGERGGEGALPGGAELTLGGYYARCVQAVDEAFERQKDLAERLVERDAARFPGMR